MEELKVEVMQGIGQSAGYEGVDSDQKCMFETEDGWTCVLLARIAPRTADKNFPPCLGCG